MNAHKILLRRLPNTISQCASIVSQYVRQPVLSSSNIYSPNKAHTSIQTIDDESASISSSVIPINTDEHSTHTRHWPTQKVFISTPPDIQIHFQASIPVHKRLSTSSLLPHLSQEWRNWWRCSKADINCISFYPSIDKIFLWTNSLKTTNLQFFWIDQHSQQYPTVFSAKFLQIHTTRYRYVASTIPTISNTSTATATTAGSTTFRLCNNKSFLHKPRWFRNFLKVKSGIRKCFYWTREFRACN